MWPMCATVHPAAGAAVVEAVLDDGALTVAADDSAGGAELGDASFAPQLASSNPTNPTQSVILFFIADPRSCASRQLTPESGSFCS